MFGLIKVEWTLKWAFFAKYLQAIHYDLDNCSVINHIGNPGAFDDWLYVCVSAKSLKTICWSHVPITDSETMNIQERIRDWTIVSWVPEYIMHCISMDITKSVTPCTCFVIISLNFYTSNLPTFSLRRSNSCILAIWKFARRNCFSTRKYLFTTFCHRWLLLLL